MAKIILTLLLIVSVSLLSSCYNVDSGKSQIMPRQMKAVPTIEAGEADIVEQMTAHRLGYRQYLVSLISHYEKTGNNTKLSWAKDELKVLEKIPQYNYIIEAITAGPNLKASVSITEADYMYDDALRTEKKAGELILIKNEDMLRMALAKYNRLIRKHPSSDKIDDAAFRAGGICEHFNDYTIALLYYQRAYQWDPETIRPAKFRAAYILDRHMHRRAEALQLYKEVLEKGGLSPARREFIKERVAEFTKSDKSEK